MASAVFFLIKNKTHNFFFQAKHQNLNVCLVFNFKAAKINSKHGKIDFVFRINFI
jgi:hypothetical protein